MADESGGVCAITRDAIQPLGDFTLPLNTGAPFAAFQPSALDDPQATADACAEANIHCDLRTGKLTALIFGMLVFSKNGMRVVPLWTVSEDAQILTMDFYHEDCFNEKIPLTKFKSSLPEGCRGVDKDALGEAAAKALTAGEPVRDVVVAHGREAVQGRDGRIQLKYSDGGGAGEKKEDGTIDFKERGKGAASVQEGEEIAILHPPRKGRPGYDVLGNELPAEDGQPAVLKAGYGVTSAMNPSGQTIYTSTVSGMVVVKDDTITISDVMEIASDVDMTTGNVRVAKGSILIKGTVTTGFEVEAADDIHVEVVVENAVMKAGNDIVVAGGVLMEEGGRIEAGGNVSAKFLRNATIRAAGDVVVEVDMVNCDIIAGGRIIAGSDKGVLNGGTYVSGGADVAEIGSESGTRTSVSLVLPESKDDGLDERAASIRERVEELEKFIGTDDIKNTLLMAPKSDRALLVELFKIKGKLLKQLAELDEERAALLRARGEELAKLRIKARKAAHQGTTINIGDKSITLNKAELASKFHWDPERSGIIITGL